MTRARGSAGFSLIELLAAVAIFAVVAVMTQQALVVALRTETQLSERRQEIVELQRAVALLGRDLENAAPRRVRRSEDAYEPVLSIGADGASLSLTRGGLPNPAGLPRSGFQRVRYAPGEDGKGLERRSWRRLDPAPDQEPETEMLLAAVEGLRFRVWTPEGGWTSIWPEPDNPATESRLPDGVEAVLETRRFGTVRRVVSLK